MALNKWLRGNKEAILDRWLDTALSAYPDETSVIFRRQKDPFANPIGHSLRTGLQGLLEALLGEVDDGEMRRHLHDMLSIRAVQDLAPSRALEFILELKVVARSEAGGLPEDIRDEFDHQVDSIALAAFDVYTQCRERLSELRINEIKRQVSWVSRKVNGSDSDPCMAPIDRSDPRCGAAEPEQEGV
jgi:hypothetical protein